MASFFRTNMRAWMRNRWVKALAGVCVGVVVIVLIAPYFLKVDRYRGRISDLIAMQTGREISLGRLSLRMTVLPRMGFSAAGFRMANPPGFAQGDFISSHEVRGTVAFWPLLLRGEIRLLSLELNEPRLTFLRDDRGRDNYSFPARARSPLSGTAVGAASSANLFVDLLQLREARILYGFVDRRGGISSRMQLLSLDADLRHLVLRPLRVSDWDLEANLAGAQMFFAGLGRPLSFDSGNISLRQGKLDSNFSAQWVNTGRLTGALRVPSIEQPVPDLELKTNELDLDSLATLLSLVPAAPQANRMPAGSSVPVDSTAEKADQMLVRARLDAQRVRHALLTAGPLSAELRVFTDRTEMWPFTLRLAEGAVQLTARTDRRQVPQRFSANVQMRDVNTETLLRDTPELQGQFAGIGELDAQLVGSLGQEWDQLLTGSGKFSIRNGRIRGFSLLGTARNQAKSPAARGDTEFTRLSGDLIVRNRRITSRQIHMDTSRGTLDLRGSTGFDGILDYQGQIIAPLGASSQGLGASSEPSRGSAGVDSIRTSQSSISIALGGTLRQPQLRRGNTRPGSVSSAGQAASTTR
jgi:uncharacterized protein involved in outer membrane biogenesis